MIKKKEKSVIRIKPVSKNYITGFSGLTGKRINLRIEQPITGNLIDINNNLYIVIEPSYSWDDPNDPESPDEPILEHHQSKAYIVPVHKVIRQYAIIDPNEDLKIIRIIENPVQTFKWKAGTQDVNFL